MTMINRLAGEFDAVLAGERHRFDTMLATVARIEEACAGPPIVEILDRAALGRRARDHLALIAAALTAQGRLAAAEAEALAGRATLAEAEAFALALIRALGFEIVRREGAEAPSGESRPLPAASAGAGGGPSPSPA